MSDTVTCRKSGTLNSIDKNCLSIILAGVVILVYETVSEVDGLVLSICAVNLQCMVTWSPAAKIFLVVCTGAWEFASHKRKLSA